MGPPKSLVAAGATVGLAVLVVFAARARAADVAAALRGRRVAAAGGVALSHGSARAERRELARADPAVAPAALADDRCGCAGSVKRSTACLPAAQIGGDFARARLLDRGRRARRRRHRGHGRRRLHRGDHAGGVHVAGRGGADPARERRRRRRAQHLGWLALVIGIGALTAAALLAVARFGVSRLLNAMPLHLHSRWAARLRAGGAGIDRALRQMRRRPGVLLAASVWHLAGWLAQVGETWLVLRLLGHPVSWAAALAIESLAAGARGAAFVVPGGIGVQEGALVAVSAAFGVAVPTALALGIIKRGRELLVGAPAMVAWGDRRAPHHRHLLEEGTHEGETPVRACRQLAAA